MATKKAKPAASSKSKALAKAAVTKPSPVAKSAKKAPASPVEKKQSASKVTAKPVTKVPAKKAPVKQAVKPAQKVAVKKVAEVLKKPLVAPKAMLVKPSELVATAQGIAKEPVAIARTEFAKPVTVRAPQPAPAKGLTMADIRSNLNRPLGNATPVINDRDAGSPYLRTEPGTAGKALSIGDVFRHIGRQVTGSR